MSHREKRPYAISVRIGFMTRRYFRGWDRSEGVTVPMLTPDTNIARRFATKQEALLPKARLKAFYARMGLHEMQQSVEISDVSDPF